VLTAVWNPYGFDLIDVLPKGRKFNGGHSISHILRLLPEIVAPDQDDPRRDFVIYAANTRLRYINTVTQFLDHSSLRRASHPPYSPDLPQTSDFSGI
jgi:hypothetical protein